LSKRTGRPVAILNAGSHPLVSIDENTDPVLQSATATSSTDWISPDNQRELELMEIDKALGRNGWLREDLIVLQHADTGQFLWDGRRKNIHVQPADEIETAEWNASAAKAVEEAQPTVTGSFSSSTWSTQPMKSKRKVSTGAPAPATATFCRRA